MKYALSILIIHFVFISKVWADCTTPAGVAGQMTIVTGVTQWCDGTNWQDPAINVQLGCVAGDVGTVKYVATDAQVCDGSFWYSILGTAGDSCSVGELGTLTWRGTYGMLQYCDGVNWYVPYVAATPTVTSLNLNSGAAITTNNNVQSDLAANVVDSFSTVTHFCYKYTSDLTVPTAPTDSDNCWQSVDDPSPGITPASSISFSGHYYLLGFTPASYDVFAWVKTSAGQISTLSNAGNGTDGVDKKTIEFDPNPPPVVINVLSAATDGATFPLSSADTTVAAGNTVYIKWNASAISGFGATPITLYYTEDEVNYTLIAGNVANSANAGCTVDGSTFIGCYTWTNGSPTSSYYRIRVEAEDTVGITAFNSGPGMNTSTFNTLAGNTDPGLGGSAQSAVIFNYVDSLRNDEKSFVVTPDGTFYIRDSVHGIVEIDPNDGVYSEFIPYTGSINDGAIGTATLGYAYARLTLDYDGNLIIYDNTKIRKVDLTTNTVTTIVGGGGTVADGTDALSFSLACAQPDGERCPLTVLPNGDMYFLRRASQSAKPSAGEAIWHYDESDGKVYSIVPSGTGVTGQPALDISDSYLTGVFLAFDTGTSNIDKFYAAFREDPCVGCGPRYHPAELNQSTWASLGSGYTLPPASVYNAQISAMDGKLYFLNHLSEVYKYDEVGDSWTKMLGTGSIGNCADGTVATSCDAHIQDAFVTAQGNIYFLDRGLLRTVDGSNEVVTLYGQKRDFGDGGLAISARFNNINSIDETSSGKIAMLDVSENVIREFTVGGNINKLVGNGSTSGITSGNPGSTEAAPGEYWGNKYNIKYDDSSENLYFYSSGSIYRYERSDSNVYAAIGHGATAFDLADGLVGSSISVGGYPEMIYGFDGTNILLASHYWNGTNAERSYLKLYDKTDSYRQSHFAGSASSTPGSFPSDGTTVSTADMPSEGANRYKMGFWDSVTSTWYFSDSNKIRSFPVGGTVGTLVTLPRVVSAWTMTKNASDEWVAYYCSSSRMYKYNITTTTETTLPWPSSTISCAGTNLHISYSRGSVVFPYKQNGLSAIAEILDSEIVKKAVFSSATTSTDWVVPTGVTSITVKAWGAGGAGGNSSSATQLGADGGGGGFVQGTFSVTPGTTLKVVVGSGGLASGFVRFPGGGGGYTGVFAPSISQANALIVAGAGGGGGGNELNASASGPGGGGGGSTGQDGGDGTSAGGKGTGGSQVAGGSQFGGALSGGYGNSGGGAAGGSPGGGAGGNDSSFGGGGGAGYYGGGGAISSGGFQAAPGGGGGSSFTAAGATTVTNTQNTGRAAINSTDPDYVSGHGSGGVKAPVTTGATAGEPGLVIISY